MARKVALAEAPDRIPKDAPDADGECATRVMCGVPTVGRIELRTAGGPLLGVLKLNPLRLEVKRGRRLFEVDLEQTMAKGTPEIVEQDARSGLDDLNGPNATAANANAIGESARCVAFVSDGGEQSSGGE